MTKKHTILTAINSKYIHSNLAVYCLRAYAKPYIDEVEIAEYTINQQVGDAQVSEKHSGFVINRGNATASDVMQLISDVKDKVKEQFGVTMEPEVKRVGRF